MFCSILWYMVVLWCDIVALWVYVYQGLMISAWALSLMC